MKYYLDSAKIEEIRYAYENYNIDGVTTNPKHIKNSGKSFLTVIAELAAEFKGKDFPISVEINPHLIKTEDMIEEAKKISAMSENFIIKIPCTEAGLIAAYKLESYGIKTNVTLVFSSSQALQAGRIGASYVSPFIGWQEDSGVNCTTFLEEIILGYRNFDFETKIIGAAIRNGVQIVLCSTLGIDIVTAGLHVYKASFEHPFTQKGLKIFQDAWDETEGN
jgi:transaldolase